MGKLVNRARMTTATTGTGTITLGSAVTGYADFATAGVANADVVSYCIEDGTSWELGTGTYTSAGTTLSRTVTLSSAGGTTALTLSGSAQVFVTALAADLFPVPIANGGTGKTTDGAAIQALNSWLFVTSAAGTPTLPNTSPRTILVTGTLAQTIQLPDVTTLALGWTFNVASTTTGVVTVNSSGANQIGTASSSAINTEYTCILATGTTAASWQQRVTGSNTRTGAGALVFGSSPTLTTPALSGETFSTAAAVTAGTNAQGQGALTSDLNIITTTTNNPSGVTLPTATVGRRLRVINKGTNPIVIYPATGAAIDALAANAGIQLAVGSVVQFDAASTTLWYSNVSDFTISGPGGLGYSTGAGGTVTQATSRATGVTLNKTTGSITLFTAAGSATPATVTVTNSTVGANDTVILAVKSGATNTYNLAVTTISAGSYVITFWTTGGTASDTPVITQTVIKGAVA